MYADVNTGPSFIDVGPPPQQDGNLGRYSALTARAEGTAPGARYTFSDSDGPPISDAYSWAIWQGGVCIAVGYGAPQDVTHSIPENGWSVSLSYELSTQQFHDTLNNITFSVGPYYWKILATVTAPSDLTTVGHFGLVVNQRFNTMTWQFVGSTTAGGFASFDPHNQSIDTAQIDFAALDESSFVAETESELANDDFIYGWNGYNTTAELVLTQSAQTPKDVASHGIAQGRTIVEWEWDWGDASALEVTTTPNASHSFDGDAVVSMTPIDQWGLRGDTKTLSVSGGGTLDTVVDRAGRLWTVLNDAGGYGGSGLAIRRFDAGSSSGVIQSTLSGYRNGSICIGRSLPQHASEFYLLAQNSSSKTWDTFRSDDGARSWTMAGTAWDATYKNPRIRCLSDGRKISVALNSTSGNFEFKIADVNGATWGTAVVIGAAGSAKAADIQVRHGHIEATNGYDAIWRSNDTGKAWTAI